MKMTYEEKAGKAITEIYTRMFRESDPSADFNKMLKSGETKQRNFFMRYYLNQERQEEIIQEVCNELKIDKWLIKIIRTNVVLGSSPTATKEAQLRHIKLSEENR